MLCLWSCTEPTERTQGTVKAIVDDLTVANRGVAASIGSQDAAQGRAACAVHDWVAREGAVQVLLNLKVPVPAGWMPPGCHSAAQFTAASLCTPTHTLCIA